MALSSKRSAAWQKGPDEGERLRQLHTSVSERRTKKGKEIKYLLLVDEIDAGADGTEVAVNVSSDFRVECTA